VQPSSADDFGAFRRRAATEFSFFLAVLRSIAAGAYDFEESGTLRFGRSWDVRSGVDYCIASAFLCVRWLLRYHRQPRFHSFAWYRIAFGVRCARDVLDWVGELVGG